MGVVAAMHNLAYLALKGGKCALAARSFFCVCALASLVFWMTTLGRAKLLAMLRGSSRSKPR